MAQLFKTRSCHGSASPILMVTSQSSPGSVCMQILWLLDDWVSCNCEVRIYKDLSLFGAQSLKCLKKKSEAATMDVSRV